MSDSGAPASTRAAATVSVRGVAFGWAKVEVSITMPAISSAAIAPSSRSSGAPSRAASSVTISQVAALAGSIQSASPVAPLEAWWSITTRGSRSNSSRMALGDRADAVEGAAVADDEQVVVDGRIGVGPGARGARQEVVERRDGVGEHRRSRGRPGARRGGTRRASRRGCRRRGSRDRRRGRAGPTVSRSTTVGRDGPEPGGEIDHRLRREPAAPRGFRGVARRAASTRA